WIMPIRSKLMPHHTDLGGATSRLNRDYSTLKSWGESDVSALKSGPTFLTTYVALRNSFWVIRTSCCFGKYAYFQSGRLSLGAGTTQVRSYSEASGYFAIPSWKYFATSVVFQRPLSRYGESPT